jgi:hypothetical protein
MLMTQRFVQLAQADAAPSAILSSARKYNFRDFGFGRGVRTGTNNHAAFVGLDQGFGLARRQNRCGYEAGRKFVA